MIESMIRRRLSRRKVLLMDTQFYGFSSTNFVGNRQTVLTFNHETRRSKKLDPKKLDLEKLDLEKLDLEKFDPEKLDPEKLDPEKFDPERKGANY
ncbi:hypothetical protein WISP_19490 [Willisornis vidua]|uniref:Uncharacterized protein n=1 Tax=Willisornis vidua TaxID=1566151 RepID=A0ABQ9DNU0_9PASS|nr:hypothetical protein WISP_19490 [Willisornis vidua]